jgi:hypothetical protein
MGRPTTRFRKVNEMDTITDAQVVNAASTGSQALSLDEAAKANLDTGVLLLCKESLITAIQDRRLHRGHLRVLAAIAMHMNSRTGKAWPGRQAIGETLGMPVKTVSNLLLELREFGYLIAARQMVEEANNRNLMVYTFGNIDHDTIRREITKFIEGVRSGEIPVKFPPQREQKSPVPAGQSRPGGNSEVPSQRDSPVPAGTQKSRPSGTVPSQRDFQSQKSRPSGCKSPARTGTVTQRRNSRQREGNAAYATWAPPTSAKLDLSLALSMTCASPWRSSTSGGSVSQPFPILKPRWRNSEA